MRTLRKYAATKSELEKLKERPRSKRCTVVQARLTSLMTQVLQEGNRLSRRKSK